MLIRIATLFRCWLDGLIRHVKVDAYCRFNKRKLVAGLSGFQGSKRYPIILSSTKIAGNVEMNYGCHTVDCQFNTSGLGRISIGRFTSLSKSLVVSGNEEIRIGSFCSIFGTQFLGTSHDYSHFTTYYLRNHILGESKEASLKSKGNIMVGNDVWIGANTIVLSGVSIGTGAVIGAGSVVTHDLEPYGIYVGNPAKLVKYRFSKEIRDSLLQSEWWDYELDELRELAKMENQNLELEWEKCSHLFNRRK